MTNESPIPIQETSKLILVFQYFLVNTADIMYNIERQKEIDACLRKNAENPYIDEIHMLNEEIYALGFLPESLSKKVKQIDIGKRLTYHDVFQYYSANLANQICILANADIFTDESLELLQHIRFGKHVIALNRYEYEKEGSIHFVCGLQQDRSDCPYNTPYSPSRWNQDAWIWKSPDISIPNSDFQIGRVGCDNHIAYQLYTHGWKVYNPSRLISVNHYDRLKTLHNEKGASKGVFSKSRDVRIGDMKTYIFLDNEDDVSDSHVMRMEMTTPREKYPFIQAIQLSKGYIEFTNIPTASSSDGKHTAEHALFSSPEYWGPRSSDASCYLEYDFVKPCLIHILDITGMPVHRNSVQFGYVSSFKLAYFEEGVWKEHPTIFKGVHNSHSNFIKRNYLEPAVHCSKIRIQPLTFVGTPALKARMYGMYDVCFKHVTMGKYTCTMYEDDWETTVLTEYGVFKNFQNAQSIPFHYFAFPWTTLLENRARKILYLDKILDSYVHTNTHECFTVVQHDNYPLLAPYFKRFNIRYAFVTQSHVNLPTITEQEFEIECVPFPYYPIHSNVSGTMIQERNYLAVFVGQNDTYVNISDIRNAIERTFQPHTDCFIQMNSNWHFNYSLQKKPKTEAITKNETVYRSVLEQSTFSLCPSGSGPNSIRVWESLSYGSIPVILSNFYALPNIQGKDWADYVVVWDEQDIDKLYDFLQQFSKEKIAIMRNNCVALFQEYFSKDVFHKVIVEYFDTFQK